MTAAIAQLVGLTGKTPEASLRRDLTQGLTPFLDHENQMHRLSQKTIELLAIHGHMVPTPKPRSGTAGAATNTIVSATSALAPAAQGALAPPVSTAHPPLPPRTDSSFSQLIGSALCKFSLMVLNTQFGVAELEGDLLKALAGGDGEKAKSYYARLAKARIALRQAELARLGA